MNMLKYASILLFLFTGLARADVAPSPATPRSGWSFAEVGLIPMQAGGRVKPLDSFTREVVLFTTGSRKFEGWDPTDLVLSWISFPKDWDSRSFIEITREDVKRQLGLDEKKMRFAPQDLYQNFALAQYAERLTPPKMDEKIPEREKELRRVLERLSLYRNVVSGEAWLVVPRIAPMAWVALSGKDPAGDAIRTKFVDLIHAYQAGDSEQFQHSSGLARQAVETLIPGFTDSSRNKIVAESFYNRAHPFMWAWIFYLTTALFAAFFLGGISPAVTRGGALTFLTLALTCHVSGFAMRCYVAGRPPVSNMYESVIWVCFGIVVFATILYILQRKIITLAVAATLATLGLILADSAPAILDPGIHPLVPVLRSNYWLTIHVLTITLGYAAFALTLGLADVTLFHFLRKRPGASAKITEMNQLTYRAMQFGVVLLAAGTILGGVWADYSWGRFWGWDPKEVWALIALLSYLVILHARFTGWIGQFGFAVWTVCSFLSVLMAWYGVNFVLGVGLHSYGFSSGGFTFVGTFISVQVVYVGLTAILKNRPVKAVAAAV